MGIVIRILSCLLLLATFGSGHRIPHHRHARTAMSPSAPSPPIMNNAPTPAGQPNQQSLQQATLQPPPTQPQPPSVQQSPSQANALSSNDVAIPFISRQPAPATAIPQQSSSAQGGGGLSDIFTAAHFNQLKPAEPNCQGARLYTYEAFLQAATTLFPAFGTTGDLTARKHAVAGFFAHAMHETGLCFVDEQGAAAQNPKQYCQASARYPCAPGANYHGRGPLQMSWNYNYIDFGKTLGAQPVADLFQHPEQVSTSGVLLFQSALYFYMRQNSPDSMHNLMLRNPPAFGLSTKLINGALECNGGNIAQVNSRSKYFAQICAVMGVDPGNQLTC